MEHHVIYQLEQLMAGLVEKTNEVVRAHEALVEYLGLEEYNLPAREEVVAYRIRGEEE